MTAIEFALAKAQHLVWNMRLRDFLAGKKNISEVEAISDEDCYLGKWLYSEGVVHYSCYAEMRSLIEMHRELHRIAKNVLLLKAHNHFAAAQKELARLEPTSEAVMQLLDRWQQQVEMAHNIAAAAKNNSAAGKFAYTKAHACEFYPCHSCSADRSDLYCLSSGHTSCVYFYCAERSPH